jgi:hypothetical protein
VHLARFSSFALYSCRRLPAHSPGTYSFRNCCCCIPYGLVPQERIAPGSRSGQFRTPNNEVRLPLRELELRSNLHWNPLLVALGCVYPGVCVTFCISPAALNLGRERHCGIDLTVSFSLALCVLIFFSSQAIRNRVNTGVSGSRCLIDIVSSEYANFAPQSQHTL